jgi:hypothetical protein
MKPLNLVPSGPGREKLKKTTFKSGEVKGFINQPEWLGRTEKELGRLDTREVKPGFIK